MSAVSDAELLPVKRALPPPPPPDWSAEQTGTPSVPIADSLSVPLHVFASTPPFDPAPGAGSWAAVAVPDRFENAGCAHSPAPLALTPMAKLLPVQLLP